MHVHGFGLSLKKKGDAHICDGLQKDKAHALGVIVQNSKRKANVSQCE
jgi:hypothetical protein